ncbi:HNH endonuclease [Burkholderia vietnamiensis]|uniref:HNH endonuclease signature motif containing protein n=1 Tax=Burkholderia vietnamiensis TaxID=60552 RepID=UPI0009BEB0E8|nr:HNH endonuclease signature motif containing protein [Burkholderia vietnamiensis]MCA8014649.1 HNH endonuclease [Burkholderia vietnamiensis]
MSAQEVGLCQCGCGQPTRLAPVNDRSKGWVRGQPLKFIKGHGIGKAAAAKTAAAIGNRTLSSHGYVVVRLGAAQRKYEHVLIAEQALGRPLRNFGCGNPNTEVVHHINGMKRDNRKENLLVCTHEYHVALHHRLANSPAWPEFAPIARHGFGGQR